MGKFAQFIPVIIAVVTQQYWLAAALVAGIAAGDYQRRRAMRKARDAFNAGLQDRLVMVATSDGARSRVYGRVRNVDVILFKGTHGPVSEFFTLVTAHAGHEIDAVEKVFFDATCVDSIGSPVTISNASPAVVTLAAHGQVAGSPIVFSTTDTLPTGLSTLSTYYVISAGLTADTFQFSATVGGSAINTSSAGFGQHFARLSNTPQLNASGYVQVAPYNRLDNNSATATIPITAGDGSVTLPQTPVGGSVSVSIQTGVGGDVGSIEVTQVPFTIVGAATVTVTGAQFPNGSLIDGFGTVAYQHTASTSYARVRKHLGPLGQNISNDLAALLPTLAITGKHRFDNIALCINTFEFSPDAFPSGHPPQVTVVERGVRCWDPRTSAIAWTENPALIALDWALYPNGGNLTLAEVDLDSFIAAANACDVSTVFALKYISQGDEIIPVQVVEPRYKCGIVAKTDSNAGDVFEEIVASMAGQYGWSGGKLRVRAGAWRAPVATITEDWLSDKESIAIQPSTGIQDTYNILRPNIADAARDYAFAPVPQVRAEAYITADGQELPSELTLSAVNEAFRAIDICEVLLLEGRQALTATLPCNMRAFVLELFDVVNVTLPHYGWTAKEFELRGWRFSALGGVIPLLREVAATSYDPATLFTLEDLADNTELPKPWLIDPVQGFAVTSSSVLSPDQQIVSRTLATWLPHSQAAVVQNGRIEIQWLDLGGSPQTVQWINNAGNLVTWEDDDGDGVDWIAGAAGVPVLLTWVNDNGAMTWNNDVETTLEWYIEVGASVIPAGDWRAAYEPGGATSHEVVGLVPGHGYLFRARAINSIGVRSVWSTQVGIVIPSAPLVQTIGIALQAATEVIQTPVASDSYTTPLPFTQGRVLALTSYTNDTGGDVQIEFTLTSHRRVTTPASASNLDVQAFLSVTEWGAGLPAFGVLVGPPAATVNNIEDMGPSASEVFNESVSWSLVLADGHQIEATSQVALIQGSYSGVVLTTSNLNLRMTIVKR